MSAQVAIAAQYFPAYARLPRKAQRKADEFIRKFQHDPKQASIHYEPISNVADRQLRSVRIGDDYRAIVRAPERGNLFILLYVDHHDEAYRWAEGKQLAVHPATGTLQFFDLDQASAAVTDAGADGSDEEVATPYVERRLFSDFSDDQLFVGGVPRMLLPAVRALYTDADLDKLVPHIPREAADLLTGLAAGYGYDSLIESILEAADAVPPSTRSLERDVKRPSTEPPPPLHPTINETVQLDEDARIEASLQRGSTQAQFRLLDADFDLDKALSHPLDVWRVYLHPSQKKIVQAHTKGPLRITGGAGTGKTVVAMHRAAWLVKEVFTRPDDKILVTTFTKNLAHDIQNNLEKLLEPEELTRIEVQNLDQFAFQLLKSQGRAVRLATKQHQTDAWNSAFDLYGVDGYDLSFCRAEWDAVIQAHGINDESGYVRAVRHHRGLPLSRADRRKLWELFREYRTGLEEAGVSETIDILREARKLLEQNDSYPRYRSVIVDETQDFSLEALRLIRAAAGPERANDLLLVGDAHQRIYGRPAPLSQAGINIRGRRSRELRLNYRTTAAICRWSLGTLGAGTYDDLDSGTSSTKGYVSLRKGAPPRVSHFDSRAEEHAFIVEQIRHLLLQGTLPEEICLTARTKDLLENGYAPTLERAGIDFEILEQDPPRRSSIRLATMHRVKGLEFPVVFVAGVNDGIVPYSTSELRSEDRLVAEQAEQQERCLLYVATSRARDALFVTSYDTRSPFLSGLEVPAEPPVPERHARKSGPPPAEPIPDQDEKASEPKEELTPEAPAFVDGTPLTSWRLPTRMANWLSRNDVHTVGALISLDPAVLAREKNLGRKSIRDTNEVIQSKLGASWVELRQNGLPHCTPEVAEPVPPDIAALLDLPLAETDLPVRFFTWANKNNVVTLRDLVSREPLELFQARNMGRGTVGAARKLIEEKLGRRWEEVHRQLEAGEVEQLKSGWSELATAVSERVLSRSLSEVVLPAGLRAYIDQNQIKTIAGLLAITEEALLSDPSLSRHVLAISARSLVNYSNETVNRLKRWEQGFLPSLKDAFLDLDTIPRMIVTRRAGLGSPPEILEEIGATLGVTRERVRQIEKKTWERIQASKPWCAYIEQRCQEAAPRGAVPLEELENDAWWTQLSEEPDALDYFCDRLLDGRWRVIERESERFLASTSQKDFDTALLTAKRAAKKLVFPLPYRDAKTQVLRAVGPMPPAVADLVWEEIDENLSTDGEGDAGRALAFGFSKVSQIIAYLEQQERPVSIHELFAATGRVGSFPDEVFMLARGVVGLERHFPDYRMWKDRLVPLVIRLIQENGPERQWSCTDLIPTLQEEIELPDWLEHWHLAAILRRSEGIEYLGRLRVALPGVIEDSARIFVHEAAEKVLNSNSAPMFWDDIAANIRKKLDVSDLALTGILNKPPFIKVAKRTYGLLARDLPGGVEAMSEALDELEGVLERRDRGLASKFVFKEMTRLSSVHGTWTEEMCMSVVRIDPRFRISMSAAVGLAAWENVRVPSRFDLLSDALKKSRGRVSVEAVQQRIDSLYGTIPDRVQLGLMANRIGAHLDGEMIVMETSDTPP